MDGKGIWFYNDKSKLEAIWIKGKKNGTAKKIMENGDIYEINYVNGEKKDIIKLEYNS